MNALEKSGGLSSKRDAGDGEGGEGRPAAKRFRRDFRGGYGGGRGRGPRGHGFRGGRDGLPKPLRDEITCALMLITPRVSEMKRVAAMLARDVQSQADATSLWG